MAHTVRMMSYVSSNRTHRPIAVNGVVVTYFVTYSRHSIAACHTLDCNCHVSSLIVRSISDRIPCDASTVLRNFGSVGMGAERVDDSLNDTDIHDADSGQCLAFRGKILPMVMSDRIAFRQR